jgi:16S rRNA (adenine1518-N6/adenine1519-N6)-dimethyltransferase
MFQKEFAERLVANPGNKSYGRLSIISQYLCDIALLFYVGAECFRPIPEVDSAVIRMIPKEGRSYNSLTSKTLQNLTQIAFSKRRKMVGKTLKNIISSRELESIDISPSQRPEEISVEKFVMLAQIINLKKNG